MDIVAAKGLDMTNRACVRWCMLLVAVVLLVGGCPPTDEENRRRTLARALELCEFKCRLTDDVDVGQTEPIPEGMVVASAEGIASPVSHHAFYRTAHALRLILQGKLRPPVLTAVDVSRRSDGGFDVAAGWITTPSEAKSLLIRRREAASMAPSGPISIAVRDQRYADGFPLSIAHNGYIASDSEAAKFLEEAWGSDLQAELVNNDQAHTNRVRVVWAIRADDDPVATFADVPGNPVPFQPSVSDLDELAASAH